MRLAGGEDVAVPGVDDDPGGGGGLRRGLGGDRGCRDPQGERKQRPRERQPAPRASDQRSFSVAPDGRACGSISGFNSSRRSTGTPTSAAIPASVSPGWTT